MARGLVGVFRVFEALYGEAPVVTVRYYSARAIEMVTEEHPDATVHSVNRVAPSSVMLIDEPAHVVLIDGAVSCR